MLVKCTGLSGLNERTVPLVGASSSRVCDGGAYLFENDRNGCVYEIFAKNDVIYMFASLRTEVKCAHSSGAFVAIKMRMYL